MKLNIYQRIDRVRRKVNYVRKDAKVQGYMAVSHDMVTASVRPWLIEQGIVIVPEVQDARVVEAGHTQGGAKIIRYEGRFHVHFVNIDEPSDRVTYILDAHANDSSDKAPGKAMSYAVKYAMLKAFNIETGENEEGRIEAAPYTPEQKEQFDQLVEGGHGMDLYIFQQEVGTSAWAGLENSFPDGHKVKGKKRIGELIDAGLNALDTLAVKFTECVDKGDEWGAAECMEDMTDMGKHLVWIRLDEHTRARAKELAAKLAAGRAA